MCLVFEYMENLDLKQYLRENRCARRCELVCVTSLAARRGIDVLVLVVGSSTRYRTPTPHGSHTQESQAGGPSFYPSPTFLFTDL